MAFFRCITKNAEDPNGKPRVYFTCYPKDFERYFREIEIDIHKTHDCAIYYTEDMTEDIPQEDLETTLGQMNLFIVPVTYCLLTQPNRAMDKDIVYAKQHRIPILPLMMETGIDAYYSEPGKFDKLQYIMKYRQDDTAIQYEDKLKKFLDSVLISNDIAKRVRAAFDAYIFLSYRKRDRRYANELMKLIHKNPEYRDIAIWYDEFLTPGESFSDNIKKALDDSKLFTLLVTPSVLEEPEGKPNFVMGVEYPTALQSGKPILPVEMEQTDHNELRAKYKQLPCCVDPKDEQAFRERLLASIQKIAVSAHDDSPEHNFLIGLAYLEGIDVEVNHERGIELITSAAKAGLLEAMQKLAAYYKRNYELEEFSYWVDQIVRYKTIQNGDGYVYVLMPLINKACGSGKLEDWQSVLNYAEQTYTSFCETLGPSHAKTLYIMEIIANTYGYMGNHTKKAELLASIQTLKSSADKS